jgi:hypothetical protein
VDGNRKDLWHPLPRLWNLSWRCIRHKITNRWWLFFLRSGPQRWSFWSFDGSRILFTFANLLRDISADLINMLAVENNIVLRRLFGLFHVVKKKKKKKIGRRKKQVDKNLQTVIQMIFWFSLLCRRYLFFSPSVFTFCYLPSGGYLPLLLLLPQGWRRPRRQRRLIFKLVGYCYPDMFSLSRLIAPGSMR